ncbi:unnamed protein product [Rhizopus stolonifer]
MTKVSNYMVNLSQIVFFDNDIVKERRFSFQEQQNLVFDHSAKGLDFAKIQQGFAISIVQKLGPAFPPSLSLSQFQNLLTKSTIFFKEHIITGSFLFFFFLVLKVNGRVQQKSTWCTTLFSTSWHPLVLIEILIRRIFSSYQAWRCLLPTII